MSEKFSRGPATPSSRLLADALAALGEGVVLADARWQKGGLGVLFVNDCLCEMTGWNSGELRGGPHGVLHADQRFLANLRRWVARGARARPFTGEGYLKRRDGSRLYTTWTFSRVASARGASHVVITYRDMTAKRELQEALMHTQRLEAVNRLAGGVAHDFNNLLSVINGYCEILGSKPSVRRDGAKEIGEIHRAGQQAAGLVRQLLAFSRRQSMDPRVVSLNQIVRDNVGIFAKLLGPGKSIAIALDATTDHVRVDPSQLQQVLLNLTLNARDALPPGGGVTIGTANRVFRTRVRSRAGDIPAGRYLELSVRDDGRGMDERTQAHIFEPFFTTKPHGQGTGLGLALVYGVVQQSGGHIQVRSAPGRGSTFEILLPEVSGPVEDRPGALERLPSTRGTETVLVAEPDPVVRKMVAGILTTDGYDVLAGGSIGEAQRSVRARKKQVDLVIGDMQNADTVRLVRSLHAANPRVRVLATDGVPGVPLEWLPADAQGALAKPYALSLLLHTVRALLDGRGSKRVVSRGRPRES